MQLDSKETRFPRVKRVRKGGRTYKYHATTKARLPDLPDSDPAFAEAWAAEDSACTVRTPEVARSGLGKSLPHLRKEGSTWTVVSRRGRRVRVPSHLDERSPCFLRIYRAAWNDDHLDEDLLSPATMESIKTVHRRVRNRAWSKGKDFDLPLSHLVSMYERQGGKCIVSGLPFENTPRGTCEGYNPRQVSIDRIDPGQGYTKDNCRLTLFAVNLGINKFAMSDYLEICKAVAEHNA